MDSKVLVIAGMHRSGTSLTASWLAQCGLFIGSHLLESRHKHSNPEGHYEDVDFLKLHKAVLRNSGYHPDGYLIPGQALPVPDELRERAQGLIAARQGYTQWGWKEPRTTLLLDFWKSLLPEMKILVVYRHYTEVVDSLLRRKLLHPSPVRRFVYRLRFSPREKFVRQYLLSWERYNRDILNFADAHPEDTLIIRIDDLLSSSLDLIQHINVGWSFGLRMIAADAVFVPGLLQSGDPDAENADADPVLAQCENTYQELNVWQRHTGEVLASVHSAK